MEMIRKNSFLCASEARQLSLSQKTKDEIKETLDLFENEIRSACSEGGRRASICKPGLSEQVTGYVSGFLKNHGYTVLTNNSKNTTTMKVLW